MSEQDQLDQKAALEAHFESLGLLGSFDIPNTLFELSTSASENLARAVLSRRQWERAAERTPPFALLRATIRELLKWTALRLLAASRRWSQARARAHLAGADAVLVGHCRIIDGALESQNFGGFRETVLQGQKLAILSIKLPGMRYRNYFSAAADSGLPLEAYVRIRDVLRAMGEIAPFFRALRVARHRTVGESHAVRDLLSGRPVATMVLWRTAMRLLKQYAPPQSVVVLPMERHDWELLMTRHLNAANRPVWAVQNCTFSPNDLNMYVPGPAAPEYRRAQPARLFAMSRSWETAFRRLGMTCEIELLTANRFSKVAYRVQLSHGLPRILYVGSINRDKVARDLDVLATLPAPYKVEARLHPSVGNLPLPHPIAPSAAIKGPYNCIVYADTSMVFQFECDRSRLIYLDYPDLVNQDPARFLTDWPGRTIRIEAGSALSLLSRVLGPVAAAL